MKKFSLIMILCMTICLSGCLFGNTLNLLQNESTTGETEYTIEEIKQKEVPDGGELENVSEEDCTEEALHAYNVMLSHVETVVGSESYYIYDYYIVNFDTIPKSYVIKIVLKDWYTEYEASISNSTNEMIIMLSSDEDAEKIQSQLEPFLMMVSWTEDLKAEVAEKFPEYYVNVKYAYLYHYVPDLASENYPEDKSDYTYFLSEDEFYKKNTINTEYGENNSINLLLPSGTTQKKMDTIFEEMKSLFHKYCVTSVNAYVLSNDESIDQILADERITGNYYDFLQDGEFSLQSVYIIDE